MTTRHYFRNLQPTMSQLCLYYSCQNCLLVSMKIRKNKEIKKLLINTGYEPPPLILGWGWRILKWYISRVLSFFEILGGLSFFISFMFHEDMMNYYVIFKFLISKNFLKILFTLAPVNNDLE